MKYNQLKIKTNKEVRVIKDSNSLINGLSVKQYIPIDDKTEIGLFAVLYAFERDLGISYKTRFEAAFMVELISKTTNLEFTKKQKDDILGLYDELESNGLIDEIIDYIPKQEYDTTVEYAKDLLNQFLKQSNTVMNGAYNSLQQTDYVNKFVNEYLEKIEEDAK